jgi:nicotinate-nucleotide adenylyltransferase
MAVGIYGGTFDPVHVGHIITAQRVLEKRKLDKIIFIPAYISPLKTDKKYAPPEHRLNMLKLGLEETDNFITSDIELKRKNISYTIDTLKELKKTYDEIELIIGYDNLLVFHKWHKPDEILELCKLVVLHRKVEISSTEIRERIENNLPIDFLVPLKVKEYIYNNGLYK